MKNILLFLGVFLVIATHVDSIYAGEAQIVASVERGALWNDRSGVCIVEATVEFVQQSVLNSTKVELEPTKSILLQMNGKRVSTWSDDAVVCPRKGQKVSGVVIEKDNQLWLDGSFHQ